MRANATADSEYRLDEKRTFYKAAILKVCCGVEMTDVVALKFKTRAVIAAGFENVFDVPECVAEYAVIAFCQIRTFP
jgi:hypothetical protein